MITILEAKRAGLFGKGRLIPNIVAGVIVGVVALPLAMAFAIASGAKPEQGIYTAIIGGFMVSVLGGSRVQIAGPTGAFIAILSGVTAKYGIAGLQLATLMAGLMLAAMGLAKMGAVIKFIPAPVVVGFTTGIAVIIFVGQWKDFLGLPAISGEHFHEKLLRLIEALPQLHPTTTALAVLSLLLVLFSSRIRGLGRVPGPLTAMVVVTVLQASFQFEGVATIGSAFGGIPQGLPAFTMPTFTLTQIVQLMGPAFTIAMLGAIESLLSATVADGMAGTKHDPNQELVGQGLANIATPLFGGFAATGAIARTATNIRNGGTSPLAGVTHTLTLVAVLLFLAPLASNIPLASLAAILFVVAYNMSELKHFFHIVARAPRADVAILLVTFVLTVLVDLVAAVSIGVILAFMQFLRRMADTVDVQSLDAEDLKHELKDLGLTRLPRDVLVYEIDGPFFFGAVENFESALKQTHSDPRVLIVRLHRVPFIDSSGLQAMDVVVQTLQKRGVRVMLCEANERVRAKLWKYGVLDRLLAGDYAERLSEQLAKAVKPVATQAVASGAEQPAQP
ncbi:MAG: STAS domain-containing protein [Burkholderiales bacterium]|nr:STAS domain-containing protein [Burkholderiales bacterium]